MKAMRIALFVVAAILVVPAFAQDPRVKEMETLGQSVKADKKALVSKAMQLTDAEAKGYWPVYEAYQKDLQQLNQRMGAVVGAYANAYNKGPVANDVARKLLDEALAVDEAEAKLKSSYAPKILATLPATKAARYIQIENKIRAVIRYELAAGIPLVE